MENSMFSDVKFKFAVGDKVFIKERSVSCVIKRQLACCGYPCYYLSNHKGLYREEDLVPNTMNSTVSFKFKVGDKVVYLANNKVYTIMDAINDYGR